LACPAPTQQLVVRPQLSDPIQLEKAAAEICKIWNEAKSPLIWGDVELHKWDLAPQFRTLVDKLKSKFITGISGKSLMSEFHENFAGVYVGRSSPKPTLEVIKNADLILVTGFTFLDNDLLGMSRDDLCGKRMIHIGRESVRLGHHYFASVSLKDVMDQLLKRALKGEMKSVSSSQKIEKISKPIFSEGLTYDVVFDQIVKSKIITKDTVCIGDSSMSIIPLSTVQMEEDQFVSTISWGSKGSSLPAACGVHCRTGKRPIVFIGDTGFQTAAHSLTTLHRLKCQPIIFLFNNCMRGLDQWCSNPTVFKNPEDPIDPFNETAKWNYSKFVETVGGTYFGCDSPDQLNDILKKLKDVQGVVMVELKLDQKDVPQLMKWRFE